MFCLRAVCCHVTGWPLANELAECTEARMWECIVFTECANNNWLAAVDGSAASRDASKSLRQVAFGVATISLQILSGTSFELQRIGFLGGQVPGRQTVPRADLWEAIQVLSRADEKTNSQIPIDES